VFEIGTSLRDARLRQGCELADAEAATKIRSKYLRALEEDRFELLPAQTYVKGFLHAYAEYLGLDGQLYVDEYNSRYGTLEEESAPRAGRRQPAATHAHRSVESRMVLVALAGIAAASALVVIAWKAGDGEQATIPNLGTDLAGVEEPEEPPAAPEAERPRPAALSIVAVQGPSALRIHKMSATGELLFSGTLEQGKSLSFTWRQFWLEAGAPQNLRVRVNGAQIQLGARRVVVTADGIRAARG
jgi:cytoskeleton protein RodZ